MRRLHTAPTRELWTSNLVDAARAVGETEHQQSIWLAPDRFAWERPEELINTISDDFLLELYIEEYGKALPRAQTEAVTALRDELNHYCDATPKNLDPCRCLRSSLGGCAEQGPLLSLPRLSPRCPSSELLEQMPVKSGGLNRSMQHLLAVYSLEFETPRSFAGAD